MTAPFAEQLARSRSTSIEIGGELLFSVVDHTLDAPLTVVVTRLRCCPDRAQGLVIDGGSARLTVGMVNATRLTLWSDTAPEKVAVDVREHGPVTLKMWNTWRDGSVAHAWVGWAAIKREEDESSLILSCNDGHESGGFDDLVVAVETSDHGSGTFTTAVQ